MIQKTSHTDVASVHVSGGGPAAANVEALWKSHKVGAGMSGVGDFTVSESFSELVANRVNESLARFRRDLPERRPRGSVLRRAAKLFVSNSSPAQIVLPTLRIS